MGETLAQRTIDKLGLDMSAEELQKHVKASAKLDTVLINVEVLDQSPVRARDIANALSDEFVVMVRELETPADGGSPDARVVVEQRASIPDASGDSENGAQYCHRPRTGRGCWELVLRFSAMCSTTPSRTDRRLKRSPVSDSSAAFRSTRNVGTNRRYRSMTDNSAIAEAFRKLRTNLQFLAVDNPPRVIVVTSSMPNEGKTTTAINIALALAEAEHNVVLVDGDMRRPMLDKYLDLVGPVGFSTVLSGAASLSDVLQKTKFPGLTVLTSGAVPPNPSELLGSLAAQKMLSEMRASFDYVIVDSSPLLAVTDAAILAANSDGVLIMARFGQTKREQLAHAVGTLEDVGAPTTRRGLHHDARPRKCVVQLQLQLLRR